MAFGFGVLRLSADQLWGMTPLEINAALEGTYGRHPGAITRQRLSGLMAQFPDKAATEKGHKDG